MAMKALSLAIAVFGAWLMVSDAVTIPRSVQKSFNDLGGSGSYLQLKIKGNALEKDKSGNDIWDNILNKLPNNACRFVVYVETPYKVLVKWCPTDASDKAKYEAALHTIQASFPSIQLTLTGTEKPELTRNNILAKIAHVAPSRY